MWFFMILSYILILLSGIGLNIIGLNHYFDLQLFNIGIIKLDLFISMIFIATQTLVMFFFCWNRCQYKRIYTRKS